MLRHFLRAWAVQEVIQCPAGKAWLGETPQERSDEEAHGPPAESVRLERKSTQCLRDKNLKNFYIKFSVSLCLFKKAIYEIDSNK